MPSRRMGGAKRYLSVPVFVRDGFRFALPIIRIRLRDLAALIARDLHLRLSLQNLEGAGKTGCLLHPRSRVRFAQTKGHTSIQGSWSIPAFPAQWLYGLLRALPGERLFCLRRLRAFTQAWRQQRDARTTRLHRTFQARTSIAPSASIASRRASVTFASAPHSP